MAGTTATEEPPSLFRITLRRSTILGRFFLIYGTALSAFLGIVLAFSGGSAFASAYPLLLPIFASVGSMGGLAVFTSDRLKGTLEYFMAYGVSPRRLFLNFLLASLVLVTIVVGVGAAAGIGLYLARGHVLTSDLAIEFAAYGIPMSYASTAFAATMGMYWSALSSPRSGLNSPIGLAPFIGILPPVGTLIAVIGLGVAGTVSVTTFYEVAVSAMALVAAFVILLLAMINRFLRRERLLSPA